MSKNNKTGLVLGTLALSAAGVLIRKGWGKDISWWKRIPEMTDTVVRQKLRHMGVRQSAMKPPRPWRPHWLPDDLPLRTEAEVVSHVPEERADLFMAVTGGSTEVEVLNWLYATICLTKPQSIVETGSYEGLGTVALATACRDNGFGVVHAVEIIPEICEKVTARLKKLGLADYVEIHCQDSLTFLRETDLNFDMGFFDSHNPIRHQEYEICVERGILTGVAAFHDTTPYLPINFPKSIPGEQEWIRGAHRELAGRPGATGYFENRLSRGLFVIFSVPSGSAWESFETGYPEKPDGV